MAELKLLLYPHPMLTAEAESVPKDIDTHEFIKMVGGMFELMRENAALGLAAPQVGMMRRLFVAYIKGKPKLFINPQITGHSVRTRSMEEGCLSLPGVIGLVQRPAAVRLHYYASLDDLQNNRVSKVDYNGVAARVVQHENDHLDGVLFITHLSGEGLRRILPKLEAFTQEARNAERAREMQNNGSPTSPVT